MTPCLACFFALYLMLLSVRLYVLAITGPETKEEMRFCIVVMLCVMVWLRGEMSKTGSRN